MQTLLSIFEDSEVFFDLKSAKDEIDFALCASKFASSLGFDWLTYCSGGNPEQMFSTYPKAWCDYYKTKDFCKVDPVCRLTRAKKENVIWILDRKHANSASDAEAEFFTEAFRFGICTGVSVKLGKKLNSSLGVLTLSSRDQKWCHHYQKSQLETLILEWGYEFECRIKAKIDRFHHRQPLTNRQRECLQKAAQGLSAKRIALETGISPRTVEFHLDEAKKRLNVSTITQAVAMAMSIEFPY